MKQVLYWILFAGFSVISVWATGESLRLLLPFGGVMNVVVAYVMAIGFMIVASLGTTMLVDGLTNSGYVENKNGKLVGGIVLLVFFWLICSMPTNTHTFFYSMQISDIITNDIGTTRGYLQQLAENKMEREKFQKWESLVDGRTSDVQGEVVNKANAGWGPQAKQKVQALNEVLAMSQHDKEGKEYAYGKPIDIPSKMSMQQGYNYITQEVNRQKGIAAEKVLGDKQRGVAPSLPIDAKKFVPEADSLCQYMDYYANEIDEMKVSGNIDQALIDEAEAYIHKGYECVRQYNPYVEFMTNENGEFIDKDVYVPETGKILTKTARMKSVIEVWKDYFKGKYAGMGFFYFILLSILVDVGAFLFVNLAVKERENY